MNPYSESFFKLSNNTSTTLKLWERKLKRFLLSLRLFAWWRSLTTLFLAVRQETEAGLVAFRAHAVNNKRNLVGNILLVVGFAGMFLHQIFSHYPDPNELDTSWFFLHSYFFLLDIRLPFVLVMWSASFLLLSPAKFKYAVVPFSLVNSAGWLMFIHKLLFTTIGGLDVNDTARWEQLNLDFNAVPAWQIFLIAINLGTSIILSLDYLLYRQHHISRGNHTRFVGVAEMDGIALEEKEKMYKGLAREFRNQNAKI